MISCEKAAIICNKAQYSEASLGDKLKLRLHTLICRACKMYVKKNTRLSTLCRKAPLHSLTETDKDNIRHRLDKFQG